MLQMRDVGHVLPGSADVEGEIAVHTPPCPGNLVGERFLRRRQRLRIGHLEDGGDTTADRREAACGEVFLVLEARLAEVDLSVDHTWKDVEPLGIDDLGRPPPREIANRRNAPPQDANVADALAVMIDDGSSLEDKVEVICHDGLQER